MNYLDNSLDNSLMIGTLTVPWTNKYSDLCGTFSCESASSGKNPTRITLTALHFSLENLLKESLNPVESQRFIEVLGSDKA